eukprot:2481952-Pleurochrysis_carterae.AAC.2
MDSLQRWSNPCNVEKMARQLLEAKSGQADVQAWVKYLCAPRASGKTSAFFRPFSTTARRRSGRTASLNTCTWHATTIKRGTSRAGRGFHSQVRGHAP